MGCISEATHDSPSQTKTSLLGRLLVHVCTYFNVALCALTSIPIFVAWSYLSDFVQGAMGLHMSASTAGCHLPWAPQGHTSTK